MPERRGRIHSHAKNGEALSYEAAPEEMTKYPQGIYSGVPMDVYHSDCCEAPSVSSSDLRTLFSESPAHYWATSPYNPERIADDDDEKAAFVLGRAAHHLFLGEDDFSTQFIARPHELAGKPWQGNRTECRAWMAEQARAGRSVLKPDQIESVRGMAKALSAHPIINAGILNGKIEQSLFWPDKRTGLYFKSRPDAIPTDSGDMADLKTTRFYGYDLDREVSRRRYDMQAALAKWGCREVLGLELESFSFVFVGIKPPHCVEVLALDKADIELAEKDLRVAMDTFEWCLKTGLWFGPGGTQNDARFVRISDWAKESATLKREFLQREVERATATEYSESDYAEVP